MIPSQHPVQSVDANALHPGIIVAIFAASLGLVVLGRLCVNRLCITPATLDQQMAPQRDVEENRLISGGSHSRAASSEAKYSSTESDTHRISINTVPHEPVRLGSLEPKIQSIGGLSHLDVKVSPIVPGAGPEEADNASGSAMSPSIVGPDRHGEYPPERALRQIKVAMERGAPVVRAGDQLESIDMDDGSDNEFGEGED